MVGYTASTPTHESWTLRILDRQRENLRSLFPRFAGREIKTADDSFLIEFESALDAMNCSVETQRSLHDYNVSPPPSSRIIVRMGRLLDR